MLSLFPQILFLAPLATTLLRFSLAVVLGYGAWKHLSFASWNIRVLGIVEIVLAGLVLVGAWVQPAALAAVVVSLAWALWRPSRSMPLSTILLALVIALSLVVTGAGAFAFDLPL